MHKECVGNCKETSKARKPALETILEENGEEVVNKRGGMKGEGKKGRMNGEEEEREGVKKVKGEGEE